MGNGLYKDNKSKDNMVKIKEGVIQHGIFDKDIYSKPSKGIVHVTFRDYGPTATVNLIDSVQNTIEQFLVYNGFSVGISDLIADEETRKQMDDIVKKRKAAIEDILLQIHLDLFDNNTGKTNQQEFEDKVYTELNKATEEAGKLGLGALSDENRLVAMVRAGSKGSTINISQMMACVGQQAPEGRRIPYGFTDRTLPHFKKYDDGAEARGFVESSFIQGLTPQEFYFHAMSGREGLIDTAVKSVTGDTKIVVLEDGVTKCVAIGDWIDGLILGHMEEVEYFPQEANLELLQMPNTVSIQTCDDTGVISTAKVTAVTRHDPGETLYEVTTMNGRSVIVTAAKSLIVYDSATNLYTERLMADITVGDALPVIESTDSQYVIKDFITNIRKIDVRPGTPGYALYPKMYDLTVPSTLNFALENGLVVRDTADTGYIQRQLVKAMEDLTAQYDGSVRDSRMNIVQFKYGEDGINATKIESASLGIGKLSDIEIRRDYGMEGVDLTGVFAEGTIRGEDTEALSAFANTVLGDRTMLIEGIQHSKQEVGLFASVNIDRVITNVITSFQLDEKGTTDLTPLYVIQAIERLAQRTQAYHLLWAALLRFYLAPHKMILKHRLTRKAFDVACEMILVKNWQGWVQPGEQVGIIAAQSIGEPSTQMSTSRHAFVNVCSARGNHAGPIGDLIDKLLEQRADDVMEIGPDSVVLDLKEDVYITGVSNDEKTSWKRISQVSRHPANGGLVKVTTKSGRSTTATLTHSFLKRTEKGVEPILGSELRVGMRVPIATKVEQVPQSLITQHSGFTLDKDFGWLCGIYLADGSFSGNTVSICKIHPIVETSIRALAAKYSWPITVRNYEGEYGPAKSTNIYSKELKDFLLKEFKTGSYEKVVGPVSYSAPREFQYGLIGGYFDGDGNVNAPRQQIRASSRSKQLIRHMNRLLSYCGFFAVMSEETSIRIPEKISYTLNILKRYAQQYKEQIGFRLEEKAAALDEIITYMGREGKHDTKEIYDKIPAIGNQIAAVGKALELPGQSRNYGRWAKKESIGRQTLQSYLPLFEAEAAKQQTAPNGLIKQTIAALKSAAYSDVIWDEITALEYLDDPKEYVYDFTVPGNDSFMVDDCILVHNTLNTFHLAGVAAKSNVTRGVPRLKELLKVTQNPKAISLTVTLKPEIRDSKEKARKVAQDLELTLLKDITVKAAIYYDPDDSDSVLAEDRALVAFYKAFESENKPSGSMQERFGEDSKVSEEVAEEPAVWSKLMLRLELDRQRMFRKNISMDDIAFVLRQRFGEAISLVYSDYNTQRLIMRIRIPPVAVDETGMDDMIALKKLQNRLLTGIVIRGVAGIKAAKFRQDKDSMEYNAEEGIYKPVTQYVLDTDGTNFLAVMNHPYVDGTKLISSHVHDVYPNLGIEATRATLIQEITTLFEEAGVNCRHLGLLCDVMTRQGRLMSVDRYGINKMDIGPIAKASFEETEKILLRAALFGEVDPVTGISANIMMGQPIHGGTGFFNILFDEGAFMRLQEGLPPMNCDEEDDAPPPTQAQINAELSEDQTDICSTARLRMNVAMPQGAVLMEEPDVEITIIGEEE
jgi:DNA-directed RNA polymerase beta' subunit